MMIAIAPRRWTKGSTFSSCCWRRRRSDAGGIDKKLDRSPNEFYRMLDAWCGRGYVTRPDGRPLLADAETVRLAQLHAPVRRLGSYATPLMRELAETSQQANQLVVFDRGSAGGDRAAGGSRLLGISIRVGSHYQPVRHRLRAIVLLAFRSDEERQMMIAEHMRSTDQAGAVAEFFARLDQIRDRGYEMMASLQTAGVFTCRRPSWDRRQRRSQRFRFPTSRWSIPRRRPIITRTIALLQAATEKLSQLAGSAFKQSK